MEVESGAVWPPARVLLESIQAENAGRRGGEKFLSREDAEAELVRRLASSLVGQILEACKHDLDYGDLWHYIKPLLISITQNYASIVWPMLAAAIVGAEGRDAYWLQHLMQRENSFSNHSPSVFSVVPVEAIISWCDEHPEIGPDFIASCVDVFEKSGDGQVVSKLFLEILDRFGSDKYVVSAISANIESRGWVGSLVPYLEADRDAIQPLLESKSKNVRDWAREYMERIEKQISFETDRDAEREFR